MRKRNLFVTMLAIMMAILGLSACINEDNAVENTNDSKVTDFNYAIGMTWHLYGFGTVDESKVTKVQPEVDDEWFNEKQYTIIFEADGSLIGHTFSNEFIGKYTIKGNEIGISSLGSTKIAEAYDGEKYYEALHYVSLYKIENDQLFLFYNNQREYLIFETSE